MGGSVLASLARQFGARREPLATAGLCLLAREHSKIRAALVELLATDAVPLPVRKQITFATEVHSDEDGGFTDIEGRTGGLSWLIIEGKFGAPLRPLQPVGYVERLQDGGSLLFLCPQQRIPALAAELERRIDEAGLRDGGTPWLETQSGLRWLPLTHARRLGVTSWNRLLIQLRERAAPAEPTSGSDFDLRSDIHQLEGLVLQFERQISQWSAEELIRGGVGPAFAKALHTANQVCPLVADYLRLPRKRPHWEKSSPGLLSPADYWDWYGIRLRVAGCVAAVAFEPLRWGTPGFPSPLTLSLRAKDLDASEQKRVYPAYSAMVEAADSRLRDMLDHQPTLSPRTSKHGWWQAPIPLRPDLTSEEALKDTATTVEHMLGPLLRLHQRAALGGPGGGEHGLPPSDQ